MCTRANAFNNHSPYTDLQPAHGNQYDIFKERYQLLVIIKKKKKKIISKESCELVISNNNNSNNKSVLTTYCFSHLNVYIKNV